jgi:hypothetical protein
MLTIGFGFGATVVGVVVVVVVVVGSSSAADCLTRLTSAGRTTHSLIADTKQCVRLYFVGAIDPTWTAITLHV